MSALVTSMSLNFSNCFHENTWLHAVMPFLFSVIYHWSLYKKKQNQATNRRLRISKYDVLTSLINIVSKKDPDWWLHSSLVKGKENSAVMRVIPRKWGGGDLFGIGKGICKHEVIAAETSREVRHMCRKNFYSSETICFQQISVFPFPSCVLLFLK